MGSCCGKHDDQDFHYEQELLGDYVARSVEISRSSLRAHVGLNESDRQSKEYTTVRRNAHCIEKLVDGRKNKSAESNSVWRMFCASVKRNGQAQCLAQAVPSKSKKRPRYHFSSYHEIQSDASQLGRALCDLGLDAGAKVAVMSEARAEVMISALACASQGLPVIPIYANAGVDYLLHVLEQTQCQAIIASPDAVDTITSALKKGRDSNAQLKLQYVVQMLSPFIHSISRLPETIETEHKHPSGLLMTSFEYLIARGRQSLRPTAARSGQDAFVILPTAGTEGPPKCITHTEESFLACLAALDVSGLVTSQDLYLCTLPMAFPAAFTFAIHCLVTGASVMSCEHKDAIMTLKYEKPTVILGGDALFTAMHEQLQSRVDKLSFLSKWRAKKKIMARSFRMRRGQPLFKSHDKSLFSEVQSALGLRDCRVMIHCGEALLPKYLEDLRTWINPTQGVLQSYGSAETAGFLSMSSSNDHTLMHVGSPLPCFEIRLKDAAQIGYSIHQEYQHGVLQCRGPGLFKVSADDTDWYTTGDVVRLNPNGTITFIDRVCNVTESKLGAFVPVGKFERGITACNWVEQAHVHLYPSTSSVCVVVVPRLSWVMSMAKSYGWKYNKKQLAKPGRMAEEYAFIVANDAHRAELAVIAKRLIEGLLVRASRGAEAIHINIVGVIIPRQVDAGGKAFTVANNSLTPRGTVKRDAAADRYHDEIEALRSAIPKPKNYSLSLANDSDNMHTPLLAAPYV